MCATAALSDGATLQPGVDDHRHLLKLPGRRFWTCAAEFSWFDATNPQKTTSTDYTTDRQSCHEPARQSDWIYMHGYPVLSR
jgi:hypothetical protein